MFLLAGEGSPARTRRVGDQRFANSDPKDRERNSIPRRRLAGRGDGYGMNEIGLAKANLRRPCQPGAQSRHSPTAKLSGARSG